MLLAGVANMQKHANDQFVDHLSLLEAFNTAQPEQYGTVLTKHNTIYPQLSPECVLQIASTIMALPYGSSTLTVQDKRNLAALMCRSEVPVTMPFVEMYNMHAYLMHICGCLHIHPWTFGQPSDSAHLNTLGIKSPIFRALHGPMDNPDSFKIQLNRLVTAGTMNHAHIAELVYLLLLVVEQKIVHFSDRSRVRCHKTYIGLCELVHDVAHHHDHNSITSQRTFDDFMNKRVLALAHC